MGGVTGALFGETKDGRIDKSDKYWPDQQQLLSQLVGMMGGQLGKGVDPYGGELVPGASDIQSGVFGAAGDALGKVGQQGYGDDTRALIEQLMKGGKSMDAVTPGEVGTERNAQASAYDPNADMEYWTKAFMDPAMKNWNERVAPQVREKFIAQNIGSSSGANNAISRSAGDMMTNLTGQLASIMQGNKAAADTRAFTGEENYLTRDLASGESEAARQMNAQQLNATLGENALSRMMQVPGFENTLKGVEDPTQQLMTLLGIGTEQRNIAGQEDQDAYTKWQSSQAYNNPWLKYLGMNAGTEPWYSMAQPAQQTSGLMQDLLMPMMGGMMQSGGSGGGSGSLMDMFGSIFGGAGGMSTNSPSYMNNAGMYGPGGTY